MKVGLAGNEAEVFLLSVLLQSFQSGAAGRSFAGIKLNLAHEKTAFEFVTTKTASPDFGLQAVQDLQGSGCFSGLESNGCASQRSLES